MPPRALVPAPAGTLARVALLRRPLCLGMLALAACTPSAPPSSITIPASSGPSSEVQGPAPAPKPQSVRSSAHPREPCGDRRPARAVVRTLTNDLVGAGATDGSMAYLCIGYWKTPPQDRMSGELRAYDIAGRHAALVEAGGRVPTSPPARGACSSARTAADPAARRGTIGPTVHSHEVAAGAPVIAVQAFGAKLLALHEDGVLSALDGTGSAVRATTKLPFVPLAFEEAPSSIAAWSSAPPTADGLQIQATLHGRDACAALRVARSPSAAQAAACVNAGARRVVASNGGRGNSAPPS